MKNNSAHARFLFGLIASSIIFLSWSSKTNAEEYETRHHLESIARSWVTDHLEHHDDERIEVQVGSLDDNIQLKKCASDIEPSFVNGGRSAQANAVILKCHSGAGWNIYVPVTVQIMTKVVVANRMIVPGEAITERDVTFEERDKNRLYDGFFRDISEVAGLSVVRSVPEGTVLNRRNVRQVAVIKRNHAVTLVVKSGSFEVTMNGIAKADGYLNESVKILNPSSKKFNR